MTLAALLRRHQARVGPWSALSLADLDYDLALITRRGRTWVQYQRDVNRLPLARHLYLEGVTAEMRGAGFTVLRRLVVTEIEDMLAGMHVSDPKAIDRYGRALLCGIVSMEDRIRQMRPKIPWGGWSQAFPYPLNEFHEFRTGIHQDLQRIWSEAQLGSRIRFPELLPPGNEEYDLRQKTLWAIVLGLVPEDERRLINLVWDHDPRGAASSRIAQEVWEEISPVLARDDPSSHLTPETCRKRYARIMDRLQRAWYDVPDIIDAIMTKSRPQ
jgi:hypothetical protein